jgi:hypothetical protein
MARGWDSKAIEDQQAAAEQERSKQKKPPLSAEARELQVKLDALRLSRTKVVRDLESASNHQYRRMLEHALAHIDGEIAQFNRSVDQ